MLTPSFVRQEANREAIIRLDFNYIAHAITHWWVHRDRTLSNQLLKLEVTALFLNKLSKDHIQYFNQLGRNYMAGFCITRIFSLDDPLLSLIVHEALCDLFHLKDIKYAYEEHKSLYLKATGENYKNWGNGYGEIQPHSDDLYEDNAVDFLALTVCRDVTKTPTICYLYKELINELNDTELAQLIAMQAIFKSGKNVSIFKEKTGKLVEYNPETGLNFYLDFRVDNDIGDRMVALDLKDQFLINKLRDIIVDCEYISSTPETGTFFIIANYKALHARKVTNIELETAKKIAHHSTFDNTPRLLYRSKGARYDIALVE